jgi:putative acetyltransferase
MNLEIRYALSSSDYEQVGRLYRSYWVWLTHMYHEIVFLLEDVHQAIEAEIASLPGEYGPPSGCLLLARVDGAVAGTVALRDCGAGICEMKRLFVVPELHGKRIGRTLVERLLQEARRLGYTRMTLETGPRQLAAQNLYRQLGFQEIEPLDEPDLPPEVFDQLPADLQRGEVIMERDLSSIGIVG